MNNVLLKYVGGRSFTKQYFNRVAYVFKKENDYSCEIPEGLAKILISTGEYVVQTKIVEVEKKPSWICGQCNFEAKNEQGLMIHKLKHKVKKEKKK